MDGKLFLTAAALLLVAACTKEDSGAAFRSDPDAVRITAQVGDGLSGGFVTTRSNPVSEDAEEQKAFKSGDKVCVTANGQKKVVYTYDGTAWNPEAGKYLKWTSPTMTFSACYPAADGVSATHFTVPADQSDADKIAAADYMTFSDEVTRAGGNGVTLAMTRKMVRIVVEPAIQNQFGGEYYVSEIKVHGNRKGYSSGNLVNGDVAVKAYKHTDGKFYALLPPTTESGDVAFIDVTVTNGSDDTRTLTAKGIPETEAGKSYTVSLKVGKNVASVTEVSVSKWNSGSDITGGEAVLVPYITFTAEDEQKFTMNFVNFTLGDGEYFEYSVNGGKWVQFTSTVSGVAFGGAKGNLRLRGKSSNGTATSSYNYSNISFGNTTKVSCTGDIRTLVDYKGYNTTASTDNARFCSLFKGCSQLTAAPDLPATTLAGYCYYYMFSDCTSLTKAPSELPATTLPGYCYCGMFYRCTQLTTAPVIRADTMNGNSCCDSMFTRCSSLTTVQEELPAMTLNFQCYLSMFENCSSLTKAPKLPATALAQSCYKGMFWNCDKLSEAPELPAETLAQSCYNQMFGNCDNLSSVTMKATDVSVTNCLYNWLINAGTSATSRKLTVANDVVYTAMVSNGYVPDLWKKADKVDINGNEIGAELTDIPYITFSAESEQKFKMTFNSFTLGAGEYFEYSVGSDKWVRFTGTVSNVAFGGAGNDLRLRGKSSKGTATNNTTYCSTISFSNANVPVECTGDIRTLINYADYSTDNTSTAKFCYLFKGCTQLTSAPKLPATTLATFCYEHMFEGCTALTSAPELPATTLANYCYRYMFNGCTNLSSVTMLATDVSANDCLPSWLFDAGTDASSRTLTVANADAYTAIESSLPEIWKDGASGTTIVYNSTSSSGE